MILRFLVCALLPAVFVMGSAALADEPDLELGEEIYDTCALCHGPFGQGGGGGVYPRLAGMTSEYIADQLRRFKDRERENIPMIPYANERELPEEDVIAVAAYLEQIELQTNLPQTDQVIDGLERLNQAKRVLNIPLTEGDTGHVPGKLCDVPRQGRLRHRQGAIDCRPAHPVSKQTD